MDTEKISEQKKRKTRLSIWRRRKLKKQRLEQNGDSTEHSGHSPITQAEESTEEERVPESKSKSRPCPEPVPFMDIQRYRMFYATRYKFGLPVEHILNQLGKSPNLLDHDAFKLACHIFKIPEK